MRYSCSLEEIDAKLLGEFDRRLRPQPAATRPLAAKNAESAMKKDRDWSLVCFSAFFALFAVKILELSGPQITQIRTDFGTAFRRDAACIEGYRQAGTLTAIMRQNLSLRFFICENLWNLWTSLHVHLLHVRRSA